MWSRTTSMGRCPAAWTASVWKRTPFSRQTAPIWAMGSTVPTSLLAYITVTRQVSGRMAAATSSAVMRPSPWTSSRMTSKPSCSRASRVWRTAWCSKAVETMCFFPFLAPSQAAVRMAWLSASLPPEVKVISLGSQPRPRAMTARADSRASLAACPALWRLEGLP